MSYTSFFKCALGTKVTTKVKIATCKSDGQRSYPREGISKITCGSLTVTNNRAFSELYLHNLPRSQLKYNRFHSVKGPCRNVR